MFLGQERQRFLVSLREEQRIAGYNADITGKPCKVNKKEIKVFRNLYEKLQSAILREDYEEAALLRDKMQQIRKRLWRE